MKKSVGGSSFVFLALGDPSAWSSLLLAALQANCLLLVLCLSGNTLFDSNMSLIGAISRTRPLLKPKREIPLAMTKWWKKKRPAEAEVRSQAFIWCSSTSAFGAAIASDGLLETGIWIKMILLFSYYRSPCIFPCTNNMLLLPGSRLSLKRLCNVSLPTFGPPDVLASFTALLNSPKLGIIPKTLATAFKPEQSIEYIF